MATTAPLRESRVTEYVLQIRRNVERRRRHIEEDNCRELVEHRTVSQDLAGVTGVKDWIARCTKARQLHANDIVEDPQSHGTFKKCELHQKYNSKLVKL
mmetsp:Transcript_26895/g.45392  ORF Transcript_26895/g.45392 Transcript_26895/m.45392 type:complete len:99 (-) Transcript_26895:110-406(-)|eukprot:CAMPEP_0114423238 /NCGR_PEP_ID=MMETSP0103-20121206/6043_1 /TAXON_ID=37642 ORGANISM="Paraphysomonas imperforata, Strain PA2" /NCGR_SAMPLE_ID=MMETSP0103 /ASSEMBLY_ACC=CAM_ASM_000201 /LENGTH=98 /DNA_ID=CAMNT_0001591889 /DNA_START=182 /DNA_END=478 /DNA_ORIENTATION=+